MTVLGSSTRGTAVYTGRNTALYKRTVNTAVYTAKHAEPIEMPFGIWTPVGPRKHVLGGVTLAPPGEYYLTVHVRR